MRQLSAAGRQVIGDIAQRHGFSVEATLAMLDAVVRGNGSMAQFSHREFGGSGQWMRGGMTMVGDMNDHQLKAWVDALCQDLSNLVATQPELVRGAGAEPGRVRSSSVGASSGIGDPLMPASRSADDWWPGQFGAPNASGSQNGARYAYFAGPRRLVVQADGRTTVHDTGSHAIGGVSQQQSGTGSLSFTSQHGPVDLATLPVVSGDPPPQQPAPAPAPNDVFAAIERLADLKQKGILSEDEFASKKSELLRRV